MARNGTGTFITTDGTRTGPNVAAQQKAASVKITASLFDTQLEDIAAGITQSISKDGQTTITANLPMNSFKLTGLAAGTGNGDSVRYQQIVPDYQSYTPVASGTGVVQGAVYGEYIAPYGKLLDFSGEVNVTLTAVQSFSVTIPGGFTSQAGRSQIINVGINGPTIASAYTGFIASAATTFTVYLPSSITGTFVVDYRGSIRVQ